VEVVVWGWDLLCMAHLRLGPAARATTDRHRREDGKTSSNSRKQQKTAKHLTRSFPPSSRAPQRATVPTTQQDPYLRVDRVRDEAFPQQQITKPERLLPHDSVRLSYRCPRCWRRKTWVNCTRASSWRLESLGCGREDGQAERATVRVEGVLCSLRYRCGSL
jgi:hypothetical protein